MGIAKLLPSWRDLELFMQLLPRSSTGERMNPYTPMWTGATEGQDFHLVVPDVTVPGLSRTGARSVRTLRRRPGGPNLTRVLRRLLVLIVSVLVVTGAAAVPALADDPGAPPGTPTASSFGGVPSVGAVFDDGLTNPHSCSASVVLTPRGGLVLTAAHCIAGTGAGLLFAPGYVDGRTPYGVWTVQRAWVSPRWVASQDPHADYAFLQVAPRAVGHRTVQLQDVTGGAVLGIAPRAGTSVTDVAYPYGIDDEPITCTTTIVVTAGYPTFNCHGYPGGTSGSPFLVRHHGLPDVVVGVIGGLHQGGCFEWNSFSSPFGVGTYATYLRAEIGRPADTVPQAGSDGC